MTVKQKAFLAAFREVGNVLRACKIAKVDRSNHYHWLKKDAEYRNAFEMAQEDAADILEAEAWRRAVEGVQRPTGFYKGVAGAVVTDYSDNLVMFLLKGLKPDKYRDRQEVRVAGALGTFDMRLLPDDLIDRIANGEPTMAVLASAEVLRAAMIPEGECEVIEEASENGGNP